MKYLQKGNTAFENAKLSLISLRKTKQESYFEAIDKADFVLSGYQVCGRKQTLKEAIENWKQSNGISYVDHIGACEYVEEEIPF